MTILIAFQTSGYRTFKSFYRYVLKHHRHDFPEGVSYDRFVYLIPRAVIPLFVYLQTRGLDYPTGISFIDSVNIKRNWYYSSIGPKSFAYKAERGTAIVMIFLALIFSGAFLLLSYISLRCILDAFS